MHNEKADLRLLVFIDNHRTPHSWQRRVTKPLFDIAIDKVLVPRPRDDTGRSPEEKPTYTCTFLVGLYLFARPPLTMPVTMYLT